MKKFLLFSLIVTSLLSCEYETDKVYMRKVNKDAPPPEIKTVQLSLQEDTVVLHESKNIYFKFNSQKQPVFKVRLLIDGKETEVVNSDNGTFYIYQNETSEGMHDLQMDLFTSSGTGSIAEALGGENIVTSKKWKLLVYNKYSFRVSSSVANGFLKLKLTKYTAPDFKEYLIYRRHSSYDEIIKSSKLPEFIDSSYVGESINFEIKVLTDDGILIPWGTLWLTPDFPKTYYQSTEANEHFFKFGKTKYYNAVDSVVLIQGKGNSTGSLITNFVVVKGTTNINDTVYKLSNPIFGGLIGMHVQLVPKGYNPDFKKHRYESYDFSKEIFLGYLFTESSVHKIYRINDDEFIFNNGLINKYSISKKQIIEQRGFDEITKCWPQNDHNISISPSGTYINYYEACYNDLRIVNTVKLSDVKIHNIDSYLGDTDPLRSPAIPLSDIATGIINNSSSGFYVYDFNTSTKIAQYNVGNFKDRGLKISSNGDYFFAMDTRDTLKLLQLKNGQFKYVTSYFLINSKFYDFDYSNPEQYAYWDGSTFSLRRCSNNSIVYSYALSDGNLVNIDFKNKEILTYNPGHLFIRDLTDGSLLFDIPIGFVPDGTDVNCYLINRKIICSLGIMYYVK